MLPNFSLRPVYEGPTPPNGYIIHSAEEDGTTVVPEKSQSKSYSPYSLADEDQLPFVPNQLMKGQIIEGEFLNLKEKKAFERFKKEQAEKMRKKMKEEMKRQKEEEEEGIRGPQVFSDLFQMGTNSGNARKKYRMLPQVFSDLLPMGTRSGKWQCVVSSCTTTNCL